VDKAIRYIDTLSTWLGIPISWLYVVLMLIITYDVTLRYFFAAPTEWAFDYAIMLYGSCFMLCGAYTLAQNNHVRSDLVYRLLSVRQQATLDLVLWFLFFYPGIIALMLAGSHFAEMSWRFKERSPTSPSGPPIYHFKTVIPVAGFFIGVQGIAEVLRCILAIRTGRWPERFADVQEQP
jgi:TRAP-type mannitol/chloroaromatic compound transport system permease small subunit